MAESKNKSFYADIEQGSRAIDSYIDQMPEDEFCALCLVDLDDFRKINLTYGYQMGDRVRISLSDSEAMNSLCSLRLHLLRILITD